MIGICFLGSCSIKAYPTIYDSYPRASHGHDVVVFEPTDTLPPEAEVLGRVDVEDAGVSTNCSYEQVINLAKTEVVKIGGNGLYITKHSIPSQHSDCHQINGKMLLLPDSTFTRSYATKLYRATQIQEHAETSAPTSVETKRKISNTLYINAGFGAIYSKIYFPEGISGNPKTGFDLNFGYNWISKKGLGVGLTYSGYMTSVHYKGYKDKIRLHSIGPEFVMQQRFDRWLLRESVGLGYASYSEKVRDTKKSIGGFAYHLTFRFEYLLTKYVGIGLGVGIYNVRLPSNEELSTNEDDPTGIGRVSLHGGIHFHF